MVQESIKKIKIAFILSNNQNWLGEYNYFKSLIGSINQLINNRSFEIYLFTNLNNKKFIKKNKRIKIIKTNFFNNTGLFSIVKKISSFLFRNYDPLIFFLLKSHSIDIVSHYKPIKGFKNIAWFPDFQHIHYPNFFSKKEIIWRNKLYNDYINHSDLLIVSSKNSKKDLVKFSKIKKKIKVLNFIPEFDFSKIKNKKFLKNKINVTKKYIFTPNQFWVHKNHICIIEALKILKNKGLIVQCIFTGSNYDHRKPDHFSFLMKKIKSYGLQNQIKYLGILPYDKIINLLYHSELIINPSYFEGWSTVVEESKIINKKILLSNIDVHYEQNPKKGVYFNPKNPLDLARKIEIIFKKKEKKINIDKLTNTYLTNRNLFAKKYIDIVSNLN